MGAEGHLIGLRRPPLRQFAGAMLTLTLTACAGRESVEATRNRAAEAHLRRQIADLQALIARAESGDLITKDRVAIGLSEEATKAMLDASLPQEKLLADRIYVRIGSARPLFRGNNATVVFEALARGKATGATARLELAGRLGGFRIEAGRLQTNVELVHFKVLDSSIGDLASGILENLLLEHQAALAGLVPPLDIPVRLEPSIEIGGLDEGVVSARPGTLPMAISLAEVIPVRKRLWILLEVKAGPWRAHSEAKA